MTTIDRKLIPALTAALLLCAAPPRAHAEDAEASLGLTLDLGIASAYVFRGLNVFQEKEQMDQTLMLAPSVTWSVFETGLSLGYWGAFQASGANIGGNIDAALGAEQDLTVSYELALPHDLSATFGLVWYLYPGADEDLVGASVPMFLEPGAALAWSSLVDVSLAVSYFLGLQDEPAIRDISYLYVNPRLSKSFSLGARVGLDLGLSYGYKQMKEGNDGASNVHDVDLSVAAPIHPYGDFYVTPSLHLSWTNIEDATDAATGGIEARDFGDGLVVWGAVNVGVEL